MLPTKFRFICPSGFRWNYFFRNWPMRNKNCIWRLCWLSDRDEISNLYREPSIDAFHPVLVHLAKRFRRRFFFNRPIRNKNGLWRPCLLMVRDKMSNLYRGSSINASYQVSVHLAKGFQRRRLKCEKLTDDRRQVMAKAHVAFGKWAKKVFHPFGRMSNSYILRTVILLNE